MLVRFDETGAEQVIFSRTMRAPKGSRWETMSCWLGGGPVLGKNWANWVKFMAVRMPIMFVSWAKCKHSVWFRGNVGGIVEGGVFDLRRG